MFSRNIIRHLSDDVLIKFSNRFNSLFGPVMLNKKETKIISIVAIKGIAIDLFVAARPNSNEIKNILNQWENHSVREDTLQKFIETVSYSPS